MDQVIEQFYGKNEEFVKTMKKQNQASPKTTDLIDIHDQNTG